MLRKVSIISSTILMLLYLGVTVRAEFGQGKNITKLANLNFNTAPYSDIHFSNGRAFIGGYSDGKVHIVDVRDSNNIHLLGVYEPSIQAGILDLQARGDLLFCALSRLGFTIVDVSDPANPREIAFYKNNLPRGVHDLFVTEKYVYLCDNGVSLLHIVDISDVTRPKLAGTFRSDGYTHDLTIRGNIGYIANIRGGFRIVDLKDPANPVVMADHNYADSFTHNIWPSADGKYVFTTDETCGTGHLRAFDISDMNNIRQVGEYAVPGDDSVIHNVMVIGRYAYMSYYKRGMRVADISNPADIKEVASFETWDGRPVIDSSCFEGAWGVYAEENGRVYISDISTGFWAFDFAPARENLPSAQFTFPRGGEQFFQGQQIQIEWEVSEHDDDSFNSIIADHTILAQQLELSIDGGITYQPIATQLNGDARNFSFTLPTVLTEQGKLRLVLNVGNSPLFFHSDGLFKIAPNIPNDKPPSVQLISPRGGEQFITGQQIRVEWVSSDDKGLKSQRISFSDDSGRTFTELARLDGNVQSALINLPQNVSLNCRIQITVDDGTNPPASSTTQSNFAIFVKLPVIRAVALKASNPDRLMIDLDPAGDLLPQSNHIRPSHEENENNVTVEIDSGSGLVAYREQGKILRDGTRLITKGLLANGQKTRQAIPEGRTVTIRLTNNNGARAEVKVVRQGLTFTLQR